ncbi:MAG: response regulator transcription factor [Rhodospirillales bacterium]|nr:response regulator transcription factor [Rhodospirillales bacterium]MDE2197808.1 response regulator transcription factor [Rhodospirillales bacterium]MDE2575276.1 response regulator transcription factor [Rhodospirillales bacterium]
MRLLLVQAQSAATRQSTMAFSASAAIVDHVHQVADAVTYLRTYEYDIVVLDQELTDMAGTDAIRRFRTLGFTTPVLILTDMESGKSRAQALRAGADDLLSKPFDPDELAARIEAVVRRRNGFARSTLHVGPLEVDMASREVRVDGQPVSLTRKEYAIVELMALRKGRVIPKQNFLDHLYNGLDGPETRVIDVFICNLRKKLSLCGGGSLIDTVRGHGYIMRDTPAFADRSLPAAGYPEEAMPVVPAHRLDREVAIS